jgi:predicted transcriptional regulator
MNLFVVAYKFGGGTWTVITTKRRSEFEIVYQLLTLAMEGSKKTALMYKSNMCYVQFNKYLGILLQKEFLGSRVGNPHGMLYFTTEKGKKLLENMDCLLKMTR